MVKRTKVSIVQEKRTRDYIPERSISFNDEDAEVIIQPFNDALESETTKGEISLPVNIAGIILQTVFYVIKGEMKYNALLGRPWIHRMRAVPSTLHQMLRFPTSEGIKMVRGEQPEAREMFAVEEAPPTQKEPSLKAAEPTKGKDAK
ncbi:uncharacterized protein LOC132628496 [Lycium barbarum]|uniref:uncharacterized protein LOC132628496 n=1 Tax=Lycium barbarum TaxID=112863 RepID=UPI00293F1179|nr:uncharacterized protein LOC132628496 [Lycium barbarum]